jgi:hypothetical protein
MQYAFSLPTKADNVWPGSISTSPPNRATRVSLRYCPRRGHRSQASRTMRYGHSASVGVREISECGSLPKHIALFDRAAHSPNLGRGHFGSPDTGSAYNILSALSAIDNSGLAIRASGVDLNSDTTRATLKLCVTSERPSKLTRSLVAKSPGAVSFPLPRTGKPSRVAL